MKEQKDARPRVDALTAPTSNKNSVNKDGMETWDNQQSVVQTGGKPHRR
jgi:hypothetical protein